MEFRETGLFIYKMLGDNILHNYRFLTKFVFILVIIISYSFCPENEDADPDSDNGYYIVVSNYTENTFHKYIVETKDSVNIIFNKFFDSELELGQIDRPLTINNGKIDFYIARVNIIQKENGKKSFKNLKYPSFKSETVNLNQRKKQDIIKM